MYILRNATEMPLPKHKPELVCSHNMAGMLPQI